MRNRVGSRLATDLHDEEVRPYMQQLMNNSISPVVELNSEPGPSKATQVRGPTLLKDVWNLPPGRTIVVQFNRRNQSIGKEGRKLSSFLGIIARNPDLTPLNVDDWRLFDENEKTKLVEFARKKFSIPICGEEFVKKSIGKKWRDYKCDLKALYLTKYKTRDSLIKVRPSHIPRDQWNGLVSYWLSDKAKVACFGTGMDTQDTTPSVLLFFDKQRFIFNAGEAVHFISRKQPLYPTKAGAVDGVEPTRAEVYILTHTKRRDGRPLDEESSNAVDKMKEKLSNGERGEISEEQSHGSVAWEGDVYSQVLGKEKSGYVRGLGLGPTPSLLWGNKSVLRNVVDGLSDEAAYKLGQEISELKELNKKQEEEMALMRKNQEILLSELSWLRQVMWKYAPTESSMPRNNENTTRKAPDANSANKQHSSH